MCKMHLFCEKYQINSAYNTYEMLSVCDKLTVVDGRQELTIVDCRADYS